MISKKKCWFQPDGTSDGEKNPEYVRYRLSKKSSSQDQASFHLPEGDQTIDWKKIEHRRSGGAPHLSGQPLGAFKKKQEKLHKLRNECTDMQSGNVKHSLKLSFEEPAPRHRITLGLQVL